MATTIHIISLRKEKRVLSDKTDNSPPTDALRSFQMGYPCRNNGQMEKVTCTNWNGPAVYEENFNEVFEKANYLVECLGCENIIDLAYCGEKDYLLECPFCGFLYNKKEIEEIFKNIENYGGKENGKYGAS